MQAKENRIIEFLSLSETKFTIPVYQRNYDWEEHQCSILLKDIVEIGSNPSSLPHFIGSIVYIHEGIYSTLATSNKELSIIDGQQRLTTITLLLTAIYHKALEFGQKKIADKIYDKYLTDEYMESKTKIKLIPPGENFRILNDIIENNLFSVENNNNFIKNYRYFSKNISNIEDIEVLEAGIKKLIYVEIALERGKDDPQKIFESLNSTGLDLAQGDLIRNYILMDLDKKTQERIFESYWIPIEKNCKILGDEKIENLLSDFIRDYLTFKNGKIPNKQKVFEEFKKFTVGKDFIKIEEILSEIREYSNVYEIIINPDLEKEKSVRKQLKYLKQLDQNVINPFLLGVYYDYLKGKISRETIINIMEILQNYLWRRYVTGEPTNALNKIFMGLYQKIDLNEYYESIERTLMKHNFPTDEQVRGSLKTKNMYKDKEKLMYIFEKIENFYHNETIDFDNKKITIEHIFPKKYSKSWNDFLSNEELDKMLEFKDLISNLTLTGSNSQLGNKTFLEKRDSEEYGYKASKLHLNTWLAGQNEWNLLKMEERLNHLLDLIFKILKRPLLTVENEELEEITFFCKGPNSNGIGKYLGKSFLVLKGSKISKHFYDSILESQRKNIEKFLNDNVLLEQEDGYVFIKDQLFTSPSGAAAFILGRRASGYVEWKTYEGKKLEEYREIDEE